MLRQLRAARRPQDRGGSIPFRGKSIPGWFHLPPGYAGGAAGGDLDPRHGRFKETGVALDNDRWLSRGLAVLTIDGPGQYEAPLLGVYVSMDNWIAAGPAMFDWLVARPEIDDKRIGVSGTSFGSFFGTIVAANEPRVAATAVSATCLEPGCHTIFEEASPTFKKRFMWMSNFTDEAKFDTFIKTLTWEGHVEKIKRPYLVVAGEADELSPLEHTERMIHAMSGPRQLVIYADSRHSVGGVPAANLGPFPPVLIADWMAARLAGKPITSERWVCSRADRADREDRRSRLEPSNSSRPASRRASTSRRRKAGARRGWPGHQRRIAPVFDRPCPAMTARASAFGPSTSAHDGRGSGAVGLSPPARPSRTRPAGRSPAPRSRPNSRARCA